MSSSDEAKNERCPTCGHFVASIFDHVAGCPPECEETPAPAATYILVGGKLTRLPDELQP